MNSYSLSYQVHHKLPLWLRIKMLFLFYMKGPLGGSISVLNVMEVVTEKTDSSSGGGALEYFNILSRQSFPGPLVGGNVGSKELNKWIDERIAICKSPEVDYRKGEILQLLLSLLKISYQYYGKLRSPFGSDTSKVNCLRCFKHGFPFSYEN